MYKKKEKWKDIKNYKGSYQVSNMGRIKSFKINPDGIIMKTGIDDHGYPSVCLSKDKKRGTKRIHRLVAETFIPNPENKPEVNHIEGNKLDNRDFMLEWSTSKENRRHALDTGLAICAYGEKSGRAKLTEAQVKEIRKRYESIRISLSKLGKEYGVSAKAIHYIVQRVNWNHI